MDIEKKKRKYLQACRILDLYNELYNPCNIRKVDGSVTCNGCFKNRAGLCCARCSHLTSTGCDTNSLVCKLNYCYFGSIPSDYGLFKVNSPFNKRFKRLKELIYNYCDKHQIPYYLTRISMEDTFYLKEIENKYGSDFKIDDYYDKWAGCLLKK